jgi:hypothetical protein
LSRRLATCSRSGMAVARVMVDLLGRKTCDTVTQ